MPARKSQPVDDADSAPGGLKLTGEALAMWERCQAEWQLDSVALELLRCACVSLERAEQAARLIESEGLTRLNRFGMSELHPAARLERDHRQAAAQTLQKLALGLNR
jgi:hypothetical protein